MKQDIIIEFEVRSLDPTRPVEEVVSEILELASSLESAVATEHPNAKVGLRRVEGIPFLPELHNILLSVDWEAVRRGAETAVGSFAAAQFLQMVKGKVRDSLVRPVDAGVTPAASPKKAPVKKAKKAPSRKATKKAAKKQAAKKVAKKAVKKAAKKPVKKAAKKATAKKTSAKEASTKRRS